MKRSNARAVAEVGAPPPKRAASAARTARRCIPGGHRVPIERARPAGAGDAGARRAQRGEERLLHSRGVMNSAIANPPVESSPLDPFLQDLYRRSLELEGSRGLRLRDWVDRAQAWRIRLALRESRGNRSAAARALGIGRRTLYSKMEKLGLAGDESDPVPS